MKKLIILIPAYNEEEKIGEVIKNLPKNIDGVSEIKCVVVNDGSGDRTEELAKQAGAKVLSHSYNQGVGTALNTGIDYFLKTDFDLMVNIDADGQFEANEIKILLKPILENKADFVAGNRFEEKRPENMPRLKYYGNKMMNKFVGLITGRSFDDVSCGFRAYNRNALLNLNLFGKFTYTQETFLDLHFKKIRILQVPISVKYFTDRKSKVAGNLFKYAYKTANIIVRSVLYYKPLRFFALPGIFLIVLGLGFAGFLVWHKLFVGSYSPYKAFGFIGGGLMIFGLLMVLIGFIADMLDKLRQNQEKILYLYKKNNK